MIPYIILYLLIVLIGYINIRKKKNINNYCFIIIFLFMGFRYNVGWDFKAYYNFAEMTYLKKYSLFLSLSDLKYWDINKFKFINLELFNKIIYKIVWQLNEPQILFVIYSFIFLWLIKKGLDNEKKYSIYSWILFLSIPILFFYFTSLIRQSIAVGIVFYSYKYIKKRDIKKYLLLIYLATLFHSSAFYIIPQYFLYKFKFTRLKMILLLISSFFSKQIFVYLFKLNIFLRYRIYIVNSIGEGGKIVLFLIILLMIIIVIFYKQLKNKKNKYFINMVIIGCYIYISLISLGHLGPRISIYYIINILYLGEDFIKLFKNKELTKTIFLSLNGILIMLTLYGDLINPHKSQYVPYRINLFGGNNIGNK